MPKVFISYARDGGSGENLAAEVQAQLQQQNMEVFRDVIGLKPGDVWYHKLEFELETSDFVVLVVSEKVRTSKWVHNEVSMAEEIGLPVIPVLAEKVRSPLWLRHLQQLDFCGEREWGRLFEVLEIPLVPPFAKGEVILSPTSSPERKVPPFEKGGTGGISTPQLEANTDQYGKYTDLNIKGVIQRFRWIEPGTFMMGSPDDEPARSDNEVQRQVTIISGFWMADTAVTQSLWQVIMNNNPSHFKGEQLPVEQVSWDDCQSFIEQFNQRFSDLTIDLPTEAEWEYACRAGTQTPFSFGSNITLEQVNYDVNFPDPDGDKGVVEVKSLPANRWGLHEMHGNVWEWCEDDCLGKFQVAPVTGQLASCGPRQRVARGGSWFESRWLCRSARQDRFKPGARLNFLGFRLIFRLC
uniref:Nitrite reductase accessory protein NirV n=1 Tax=uncultured Thiotrichaceae bacterium TaxID=298394 RepID=A0A6S6SFN9_9GAMM|nr:MAG: Nitrite reductase accessory protein NirV [uncultured Thiotrichaceae bacterium]